jgi:hypothetical protein
MTVPPSHVFVPLLGRFRDRHASASSWFPPASADCTAVGVASGDTVGHIVGGGAAGGMLRAPDAVGFAGGGTGSFVEAVPGGWLAWVVVRTAVWTTPKVMFVS